LAQNILNHVPGNFPARNRRGPIIVPAKNVIVNKQIMQAHCMMGIPAYSLHHKYKAGLLLLNNMLGGTGMSSILNLQLREKHGIAYTIETNYSPLSDTGIFALIFWYR
jgi:predicted Zn-dependent peptidase